MSEVGYGNEHSSSTRLPLILNPQMNMKLNSHKA